MDKKTYDKYFKILKKMINDNGVRLTDHYFTRYNENDGVISLNDNEINNLHKTFPNLKDCSNYERKITFFLHEIGHMIDRQIKGNHFKCFRTNEEMIADEKRANYEAENYAKTIDFPLNREVLWTPFQSYLKNVA